MGMNSLDNFLEAAGWMEGPNKRQELQVWWWKDRRQEEKQRAAPEGQRGRLEDHGYPRSTGCSSQSCPGIGHSSWFLCGWKFLNLQNLKPCIFWNYCKWKEVFFFFFFCSLLCIWNLDKKHTLKSLEFNDRKCCSIVQKWNSWFYSEKETTAFLT